MDDKAISDVYWISGKKRIGSLLLRICRINTTVEGYGSNDLNSDLLFMKKLQNNPAFPVGHGSDRTASSFSFQRAPNCDADNLNEMEVERNDGRAREV